MTYYGVCRGVPPVVYRPVGLSTLSQKSATVAEFGDCRRCLAVFCNSRTFLRQCGQCLTHLAVIFSFFTHLSTVGVTQRNARWRSVLFSKSYLYTQSLSACWANSQCRNGVGRLHLLDHAWRTAFAKRLAERTLTTSATSASAHLWATWLTYSVSARHSLYVGPLSPSYPPHVTSIRRPRQRGLCCRFNLYPRRPTLWYTMVFGAWLKVRRPTPRQ